MLDYKDYDEIFQGIREGSYIDKKPDTPVVILKTWADVANYIWADLAGYTWGELGA